MRIHFSALVASTFFVAMSDDTVADASPKAAANKIHRVGALEEPSAPDGRNTWCAPEMKAIDDGTCFFDGTKPGGRRTLVVFLHGVVNDASRWQWLQERAIVDDAKELGFAVLFPRAPLRPAPKTGFIGRAWNSSFDVDAAEEKAIVDGWTRARKAVEGPNKFDETFVMGFSSGAYYAASLALRGRLPVDGYAVFAGGSAVRGPDASTKRVPFFVGVCADDAESATRARTLGASLASWGWPSRSEEAHVGHAFTRGHVAHAIAYLRAEKAKAGAR